MPLLFPIHEIPRLPPLGNEPPPRTVPGREPCTGWDLIRRREFGHGGTCPPRPHGLDEPGRVTRIVCGAPRMRFWFGCGTRRPPHDGPPAGQRSGAEGACSAIFPRTPARSSTGCCSV